MEEKKKKKKKNKIVKSERRTMITLITPPHFQPVLQVSQHWLNVYFPRS